jgi:hypothetical protein
MSRSFAGTAPHPENEIAKIGKIKQFNPNLCQKIETFLYRPYNTICKE